MRKLIILIISMFCIVSMSSTLVNNFKKNKIKIVFRCDDYRLIHSDCYDSLLDAFNGNNIPLCIGIMPYDTFNKIRNTLTQDELVKLRSLVKRNEIEVAIHGYNHVDNNRFDSIPFFKQYKSEFATVDYNNQYIKISKAKKVVDSILNTNVHIFLPPWDSYDANTLKALENLKFDIISGNKYGSVSGKSIHYIPDTHEDFFKLPKIIEKYKNEDVTMILLFHPYTFKGVDLEHNNDYSKRLYFSQFEPLLKWISKQDYITTLTFTELNKIENFDRSRFNIFSVRYNLLTKVFDNTQIYSKEVLYSKNKELLYGIIMLILNIICHILIFWFLYSTFKILFKILSPSKIFLWGFLIIFVFIPAYIILKFINSPILIIINIFLTISILAIFSGIIRGFQLSQKKKLV